MVRPITCHVIDFARTCADDDTRLSQPLAALTQVPEPLLFYAGLVLFPYAAFVGYLARREMVPHVAVWAAIVLNVLWAIDCALLAFGGWLSPSGLGYAFILMQAAVVAVFAELQYLGLRRSATFALTTVA